MIRKNSDIPLAELVDAYLAEKQPSKSAVYQYQRNLQRFGNFIRRVPTVRDLTDANIAGAANYLVDHLDLAVSSANKMKDDLCCIWRWAAQRNLIDVLPTVKDIPEPDCVPVLWTRDDIKTLWDCCSKQPGNIDGIPAGIWWNTLHAVAWDTGEQIGTLLNTLWEQVDLPARWIVVKAWKSQSPREDKLYRLDATTCALLRQIRDPERPRVWPFPFHRSNFSKRYGQMLRRVNLPIEGKETFHQLRKSEVPYYQAAGRDVVALLDPIQGGAA